MAETGTPAIELDVANLVMEHIDKLKSSGVLQIKGRREPPKRIAKQSPVNVTEKQLEAAVLAAS